MPSAAGITGKIQEEIGAPLTAAGKTAGEETGKHFSEGFKRNVKLAAAAAGVAIIAVGKSSIDAASNLDESVSKINVVFGESAGAVKTWAKGSAEAFGLSTQQALEAAGTYGNLFSAFGLGKTETKDMSQNLVGLAADLASFNNTSVDDALLALRSGLSGEAEPLKKFGVAINDSRLKTEALALGLIKSTKEALTPAAKAQASYSLIMKDTALAQGDFGRTSDGLANKQRIMAAKFGDLQATIGQALLPAMSALVGFIMDKFIPAIRSIGDWLSKHKPILIGAGILIGTVLVGAFVAWATAAWAAFAANVAVAAPVIALGVAIGALVAGVIWAYQNLGFFRAAVDAVKDALLWVWHNVLEPVIKWLSGNFVDLLKVVGRVMLAALTGGISEIIMHWDELLDFFKALPGKILDFFSGVATWLLDVGKKILQGMLDGIVSVAEFGLKTWFVTLPTLLVGWFVTAATWLLEVGKKVLQGLLDGIIWIADNVLYQYFIGIPLKILGWIGAANLWLLDKGKDILLGLVHGLESGISDVFTWFFNLPGTIKNWVVGAGTWLYDAGKGLIKGLIEGVLAAPGIILDAIKKLIPSVGSVAGAIGKKITGTGSDIVDFLNPFAEGTSYAPGGLALVGERGPEIVNLPRGSQVFPNGTAPMQASMTINISTMMGDPQEIMRVLQPALRTYQRSLS